MKNILFIIAATLLGIAAQAQTDTLRWGQHDPTYYYYWPGYGPWVDQWPNMSDSFAVQYRSSATLLYRKDIALSPFYTDRPLNIIGVAAPMRYKTVICPDCPPYWDTSIANCPQESFVLYGRHDKRPVFIDSACWTCTTPRHWFDGSSNGNSNAVELYEAYFNNPHTVMDTFYVGMTNNHGYYVLEEQQGTSRKKLYVAHPDLEAFGYTVIGSNVYNHRHKPHYQYYIPQMVYGSDFIDVDPTFADTSIWETPLYQVSSYGIESTSFPCIFPIIDTTGVNFDDLYEGWDTIPGLDSILHRFDCPRVSRLRPEGLGHGCVNMAWRGDSCHAAYQLKYGKFFDPEEDYRQYDVTGNNIYIDVDSNVLYKVMVRGRCGCGLEEWSPWVSTMFLLTAYNATVVDSNQLRLDEGLEMLTTVSPNPAHGKATVFSSLHIRSIDVYSADGHRLDHINVGGLSHELDLSRYAKGLCLLKINTYRGTTVRKLIVE